jgi:uncharacterized protein (DUF2235 family)
LIGSIITAVLGLKPQGDVMAKNIIFCADGTWNGPEDASGESVLESEDIAEELTDTALTNVVKLYANLCGSTLPDTVALKNEDEKVCVDAEGTPIQVAKYMHGVGDSTNPLVKFMGGLFGVGVVTRIVRGFTFVSRYYEPGDRIHILGFSRGAYTARALAGMIAQVGLLDPRKYDPSSKMQAYRLGVAAWVKSKELQLNAHGQLTQLAQNVIGAIESLLATSLPESLLRGDVPVEMVAVWDTVGSLGIPTYVRGARADVFRFVDTSLSAKVNRGIHAMAVDELRADFPVTQWRARNGITQMWFVGAHADVGGGYAPSESRLSDLTLDWMMARLAEASVRFAPSPVYKPDFATAQRQAIHTPWTNPPFDHLGRTPRNPLATDEFHPSVRERWNSDAGYRPEALKRIW